MRIVAPSRPSLITPMLGAAKMIGAAMGTLTPKEMRLRITSTASEDSVSSSTHSEGSGLKRSRKSENLLGLDDSTHDLKKSRAERVTSPWSRGDEDYVCSVEEAEITKSLMDEVAMTQSFDMIWLRDRARS
ncbi:hypothetical protein B484DRAFT_481263 [Ochromonadaceae sp. CCMP2298]|nr:hypothetical protein B484DRAFT_481263 [Ochromonadaceae sp. CCMP2298]